MTGGKILPALLAAAPAWLPPFDRPPFMPCSCCGPSSVSESCTPSRDANPFAGLGR